MLDGRAVLFLGQNSRAVSPRAALVASLMFALAVLFWFPYIFVLPAAIAAPLFIYGHDRQRLHSAGRMVVVCAAIGIVAYALAIAALRISNVTELKEWALASGHGQIQAEGFRAVARLAFSIPRSFINMDRDGMWLKRYLLHDFYASVTMRDLFRLSLWKLVLFYVSATILCIELLRSKRSRQLFLLLLATAVPVLIFAMFIFEAGSIERYLPLDPFIFLACAYVLGAEDTKFASRLVLILALITITAVNVNASRAGKLESNKEEALARIHDLVPRLDQNSLVLAVNEQDNLAEFRLNFPLDPINLQGRWRTYDMLEINAERLRTWREDFAVRALATWQRGGAVWLPKRVFCAAPQPEWNWVEGDDKRVKWSDLPQFFRQLETGPAVGGDDGFVLLQQSPKNKEFLVAVSQKVARSGP